MHNTPRDSVACLPWTTLARPRSTPALFRSRYAAGVKWPRRVRELTAATAFWATSAVRARLSVLESSAEPALRGSGGDETQTIAWFSGWLNDPRFLSQARGFSNVRVGVREGGLVIVPTKVETLLHGWTKPVEYDWPAVVLQRRWLLFSAAILVDVEGRAGLCEVRGAARFLAALERAGLSVVTARVTVWDGPRRVRLTDLGGHAKDLPRCVVRQ